MTMRVLVTGAGGFVPRAIVAALVRRGASVHAIDTAIDPALKLLWDAQGGAVTWTEGPADDLPDAPFDALVHGAAVTASPEERGETPEANVRANLLPLLRALEWAGAHARRAIVVSSSGIFSGESGPLDEDARPTPSGTYAVAKAFTEAYAAMLKDTYRRDVVCIRLSSIYGPDEYPRPSRPRVSLAARYLHQAITTGRIDVIGQNDVRDWTYAPDVADVVVRLLEAPALRHAVYNAASGQTCTSLALAQAVQAAVPGTQIDISETDEAPAMRGWLTNARLHAEFGLVAWTPLAEGIHACAEHARHTLKEAGVV